MWELEARPTDDQRLQAETEALRGRFEALKAEIERKIEALREASAERAPRRKAG